MNTKKLVLLSVVAFSVLVLVGCGKKEVTVDETVTDTTATMEATKDQCMELVGYGMAVAVAQTQWDTTKAAQLAQEAMDLEKTLLAGDVEFENACEQYMTDADFIKAVQKFMAEMQ